MNLPLAAATHNHTVPLVLCRMMAPPKPQSAQPLHLLLPTSYHTTHTTHHAHMVCAATPCPPQILLEHLDAKLVVYSPYLSLSALIGGNEALLELGQNAWAALNDAYRTDLLLVWPPYMIALGCLVLAAGVCGRDLAEWVATLDVNLDQVGRGAAALGGGGRSVLFVACGPCCPGRALAGRGRGPMLPVCWGC